MQATGNENTDGLRAPSGKEIKDFSIAVDDGIFQNQDEVIDGLRKTAEALGVNPDLVAPQEGAKRYYARKNCKECYGRGTLEMVPSPQKEKLFWTVKSKRGQGRRSSKGKGPTRPKNKVITGLCMPTPELANLWDSRELSARAEKYRGTSTPEPAEYKGEVAQKVFCRCVKSEALV